MNARTIEAWDESLHQFRIMPDAMVFAEENYVVGLELLNDVFFRGLRMGLKISRKLLLACNFGCLRDGGKRTHKYYRQQRNVAHRKENLEGIFSRRWCV